LFADPRAAVRAAVQAQLAFHRTDWSPLARLGIRIAVHTGEAIERAGDSLGNSLSHTARLRDVGHGGQILVSAPAAGSDRSDPIYEQLDGGIRCRRSLDRGSSSG
jgi:class 3 adenylate cyclase